MKTTDQLEQELAEAQATLKQRIREFYAAKDDVIDAQRHGTYNSNALHRMVQGSANLNNARELVVELEHAVWVREQR